MIGKISLALASLLLLSAGHLYAQNSSDPWTFKSRAILTGSSDKSDPSGYKVYSALTFETALARQFNRHLAAEFNASLQSREVDITDSLGFESSLGSVELLPLNLLLQ